MYNLVEDDPGDLRINMDTAFGGVENGCDQLLLGGIFQ